MRVIMFEGAESLAHYKLTKMKDFISSVYSVNIFGYLGTLIKCDQ